MKHKNEYEHRCRDNILLIDLPKPSKFEIGAQKSQYFDVYIQINIGPETARKRKERKGKKFKSEPRNSDNTYSVVGNEDEVVLV